MNALTHTHAQNDEKWEEILFDHCRLWYFFFLSTTYLIACRLCLHTAYWLRMHNEMKFRNHTISTATTTSLCVVDTYSYVFVDTTHTSNHTTRRHKLQENQIKNEFRCCCCCSFRNHSMKCEARCAFDIVRRTKCDRKYVFRVSQTCDWFKSEGNQQTLKFYSKKINWTICCDEINLMRTNFRFPNFLHDGNAVRPMQSFDLLLFVVSFLGENTMQSSTTHRLALPCESWE